MPPGETQLVRLSIGELGEGNYRFEAKGISPMEFQDSTPLKYYHKGYSVFIQTDKAIYRPGNEVSSTLQGVDRCNRLWSGPVPGDSAVSATQAQCHRLHRLVHD